MAVVRGIQVLVLFLLTVFISSACDAASAHIHTHQHNKVDSNERMEDGAFSPRDADHYAEGEHHQEFDHEAILGTNRVTGIYGDFRERVVLFGIPV